MRAAVLTAPGIEHLRVQDVPVPEPMTGWVRVKVMAFGLNRSEYRSMTGQAGGMTYPRVLGIEASGVVDLDPDGALAPGTQVATMMGGMGRVLDGGTLLVRGGTSALGLAAGALARDRGCRVLATSRR